jgi:hypothetical protein
MAEKAGAAPRHANKLQLPGELAAIFSLCATDRKEAFPRRVARRIVRVPDPDFSFIAHRMQKQPPDMRKPAVRRWH